MLAQLPVVGKLDHAGGLVVQGDVGDVRVERLADALADEVDQLVEVELGRKRLADAVHRPELGDALPRLVDQLRVLERDAEAAGDRPEQLLVRRAKGVLVVEVLDRDRARRPSPDDERLEDRRPFRRLADDGRRVAVRDERRVHVLVDCEWLAGLHHVLPEADHREVTFGKCTPRSIW